MKPKTSSLEDFIQGKLRPDLVPSFLSFWQSEPSSLVPSAMDAYRQGWTVAWGFAAGSADAANQCPQDPHYALGYRLGREYVSARSR